MKQGEDYFTMHFQIIASQNDKGGNESLESPILNPALFIVMFILY